MKLTWYRRKEKLGRIIMIVHKVCSLTHISQKKARQYKKHKCKLRTTKSSKQLIGTPQNSDGEENWQVFIVIIARHQMKCIAKLICFTWTDLTEKQQRSANIASDPEIRSSIIVERENVKNVILNCNDGIVLTPRHSLMGTN